MITKIFILAVLIVYIQAQQNRQGGFIQSRNDFNGFGGLRSGSYGSQGSALIFARVYRGPLSFGSFGGSNSGNDAENDDGHYENHYAPAKYHFKYGVEDKGTGDIKEQEETRHGDVVKGYYTLHEPDGTILTVHYTADKHSGFNAKVHRTGHAHHPKYY